MWWIATVYPPDPLSNLLLRVPGGRSVWTPSIGCLAFQLLIEFSPNEETWPKLEAGRTVRSGYLFPWQGCSGFAASLDWKATLLSRCPALHDTFSVQVLEISYGPRNAYNNLTTSIFSFSFLHSTHTSIIHPFISKASLNYPNLNVTPIIC